MVKQHRHVLSIDFGTANTIAVLFDGQNVDKVTDSEGRFIMPSAVFYYGDTPLIVGWDADELGMNEPDRYKTGLKRELGIEGAVPLGDREFSRVELVAEILNFLRQNAERRTGERIHEAILTVPAAYDEYRLDLMKDAGKAAGFDASIVAEPVAAAFTESEMALSRPIMVYDLGAGTFDAAIVGAQDGELAVIGHAGLPHCGGLDIDQLIYNRLRSLVDEDAQRRVLDGSDDSEYARARRLRFRLECRHQKEMLSKVGVVRGRSLVLDPPLQYELTRDWLEIAEKGLLLKTINCCRELLDSCDMKAADLDHVLLVGGSSHAPIVARLIESELDCSVRLAGVPETAVAEGAAQWGWKAAAVRERAAPMLPPHPGAARADVPAGTAPDEQAAAGGELDPALGGKAAAARWGSAATAKKAATRARKAGTTSEREPSGPTRVLVDGVATTDVAPVGDTCWVLHESPTRPVPELLRVELATGDVVKRLEAPGGTWIAASAGGVVLSTAANDFTVYDPDLNVVKQWHAVGDAGIVHVEATNRCAWVLVAESPKHIYPRGSQGYSFQAKVIRVRFDNGATKNFSLGSDTYWTSPIHYRGMQLMPVAGASGDAVAALRCEWVTPFMYIQKTKVLHLMSEGSNHVQSVKVGTYSGGAVSPPDLRQVLRIKDKYLLASWQCDSADIKTTAACAATVEEIAKPTTLLQMTEGGCFWLPSPDGAILLVPGDGQVNVLRYKLSWNSPMGCVTVPGDCIGVPYQALDVLRDFRIRSAIREGGVWWGVSDPSGIACLDENNALTRVSVPGDPVVFAADSGWIYVNANRQLQAVPLPD